MRRLAAWLVLAPALAFGAALPAPKAEVPDLTSHVRLVAKQLLAAPEEERKFVRFVSWQALAGHKSLPTWQKVFVWWLNQLSTQEDAAAPDEVPGSNGLLWQIDLRDYNWNTQAWRTVALREPYFREPWIPHPDAQTIRDMIGEKQEEQDGTAHLIAVVRADWLFRDTLETDRSTSYYDLLYARQRFLQKKADFPKDEDDWNEFFGITNAQKHLAAQRINPSRGAVVAGSRDDPIKGSIVARNNRVVFILPLATGVGHTALKTFDVLKTADERDYIEFPVEATVGKLKFDAGELLASLPNGGQAGLLINGEGKRVEIADSRVAHNKADGRFVDVRTMMGCVTCHAPDGGLIPPRDQFREALKDGIDLLVKDRNKRNQVRRFFLEWDDLIKVAQVPYLRLVARTAQMPPGALVKEYLSFRDWYDNPVTSKQAALEMGMAEPNLRLLASSSPKARLLQLAQGKSVPRDTYEKNVFREMGLLYDASRKPERPRVVPPLRLPPIKKKAG